MEPLANLKRACTSASVIMLQTSTNLTFLIFAFIFHQPTLPLPQTPLLCNTGFLQTAKQTGTTKGHWPRQERGHSHMDITEANNKS